MRGYTFQKEVAKVISDDMRDEARKEVFAYLNSDNFNCTIDSMIERLAKLEHHQVLSQEDGDLIKTIISKFNSMGDAVLSIGSLSQKVDAMETALDGLQDGDSFNEEF